MKTTYPEMQGKCNTNHQPAATRLMIDEKCYFIQAKMMKCSQKSVKIEKSVKIVYLFRNYIP